MLGIVNMVTIPNGLRRTPKHDLAQRSWGKGRGINTSKDDPRRRRIQMDTVYLVASGDLRLSANQNCEAAQAEMERQLVAAIEREGYWVKRAHAYDPIKQHGFID